MCIWTWNNLKTLNSYPIQIVPYSNCTLRKNRLRNTYYISSLQNIFWILLRYAAESVFKSRLWCSHLDWRRCTENKVRNITKNCNKKKYKIAWDRLESGVTLALFRCIFRSFPRLREDSNQSGNSRSLIYSFVRIRRHTTRYIVTSENYEILVHQIPPYCAVLVLC